MIGGITLLVLVIFINTFVVKHFNARFGIPQREIYRLFAYHYLLSFVYYLYATFNPSDSHGYFNKVTRDFRGSDWFDYYGTGTTFIEFLGFPFIKILGFSYEAMMVMFAFVGYMGFLYMYIVFKERVKYQHYWFGFNLVTLIFYLPNLHFWSGSLGKGSVIFFAIALFFYGVSAIRTRYIAVIIGSIIIYHVRPHIMLVMLVSSIGALVFSSRGVSISMKLIFLGLAVGAFFFIYQDVLQRVGIEEDEILTQGLDLSHRARELGKATSGVDINSYNFPLKMFTFLYRPLFVDATGALGLIISFENVFYLVFTLKLFTLQRLRILLSSSFMTKTAFFSFLTVSIALAQVSGNLGIAMRQKSQVMILLLFVIVSLMDEEKYRQWIKSARRPTQRSPLPVIPNNG